MPIIGISCLVYRARFTSGSHPFLITCGFVGSTFTLYPNTVNASMPAPNSNRPENVLGRYLTWANYKPPGARNTVLIEHHKTGKQVPMPLSDGEGPLFPELTQYLDNLERLGVPIVLMKPQRKKGDAKAVVPRPFLLRTARNRVRKAARAAGLPDYLTMEACRHGGITELGDAGATEQEGMASTGHTSPAFRIYQKHTTTQRTNAQRKRRIFLEFEKEQEQDKIQNGGDSQIQNEPE